MDTIIVKTLETEWYQSVYNTFTMGLDNGVILKTNLEVGTRVRLYSASGEFFALGEVRDYENGTAIKAIKTFSL